MRQIQVTMIFTVDDDATDGDIDRMVGDAGIQIEDPRDEEGDAATFETRDLHTDWFEVT